MSTLTTYAINVGAAVVSVQAQSFGGQDNMELRLVGTDFTPDPSLTLGDLTYLAADGLSPKTGAALAPTLSWDSVMGVWGIVVPFTAGTVFTCEAVTDPVKTAYGWALVNTDVGELICTDVFPEPIVFDHIGIQAHVPETQAWFAAPFLGPLPTLPA